MRPTKKQAPEGGSGGGEEIALEHSPAPSTPGRLSSASASDEISGVFRFLCDYRLNTPPTPTADTATSTTAAAQSQCCGGSGSVRSSTVSVSSLSEAASACVSEAKTGASVAAPRGVGAPPHTHTPMGSTTRLISDSRPSSTEWRCLPGLGSAMAALSLAAGLANMVRLPTMVFLHGGGSFLAIYVALAVVFGIPLVFLEVLLGQFCQEGTTKLWRAVPLLKGIGFLKVLVSLLAATYYPVIMAVSLFFAFWSTKGPLPLPECAYQPYKLSGGEACLEHTLLTPPDQDPKWLGDGVILLLVIWVCVLLCLCVGARSYRVSASLLLATLLAALGALLTEQLEISIDGLATLTQLDVKHIMNFDTWYHAVVQIFLSTHIGFGNITTVAGNVYSKSNAFWVSLMYMVCNLAVGLGFTCLMYLWMAQLRDHDVAVLRPDIPEVFTLTFMYDVITHTFSTDVQLWAVIVFLAIVFSGILSLMALVVTVTTAVVVESQEKWRPWAIRVGLCVICFLAGIICLLPMKLELVHMLDQYVVSRLVVMATAIELMGFVWVYGTHNLYNDFEYVLGYKLTFMWKSVWFITPLLLIVLQVWSVLAMPVTGTRDKTDPEWLYLTGWAIVGAAWFFVFIVAIWQIVSQVDYNIWQKFLSSLKPSRNWGPIDPIQRHGWIVWREQSTLSGERDFTLKRRGTRDYTHSVRHPPSESPGTRYYPTYSKPGHNEKTAIHDTMNGTFSVNYSSTQATDVAAMGVRGGGGAAPYTVQLPHTQGVDHVCWRKGLSS